MGERANGALALLAVAACLLLVAAGAAVAKPAAGKARCTAVISPGSALQHFVDELRPGSIGCLRSGDYDTTKLIVRTRGTARARITLRSFDPRRRATIHGPVWVSRAGGYWTFENLDFDGRNPRNLPSPIVNGDRTVWIRDDVTNHHAGSGSTSGGICFVLGDTSHWGIPGDTVILQSRIHDCGVSDNSNHGIYVQATRGTTLIADNWIYRNGDRGIQLYPDAAHVTIVHNVIDDNGSGVIFSGKGRFASHHNVVFGNIISNSRNRWNVESWYPDKTQAPVGNIVASNCLWASNTTVLYDRDGGVAPAEGFSVGPNVVAQPKYFDQGRNDFRLERGSGCVGYGPRASRQPVWQAPGG